MANTFYNRSIRKLIVAFGNVFDNITLVRYNLDESEQERFVIPIAYASKERYVMRLEGDPDLDKKVQITLPRMSFELNGISYDSSRKQNTNSRTFVQNADGSVSSQYNPVPYNFDFSLYIYVRNIEDGTQVIEHILPYFTPDYTIKVNMIPELGIIKEIPIILKDTKYEVDYEGSRENDTRMVIWTLNFNVKGYVFGSVTDNINLIKTSITNVYNNIEQADVVSFNMVNNGTGYYQIGEIAYQGYSINSSTASGKVVSWSNNILQLSGIRGNFVSSQPIIGAVTNTNYLFSSYTVGPVQLAEVIVLPNPTSATPVSYTHLTLPTNREV